MARYLQRGASLVEFAIIAPVLLGLGLGTVQAGLAYHGKTILNYATFEVARTGASSNAMRDPMMTELGTRLAPLLGGDGSANKAAAAIVNSRLQTSLQQDVFTHIEVLNPTLEAFEYFKVQSRESGEEVIPNSHLRHQSSAIDPISGVSLRDANLLKIRVTHGFDLKVPGVARVFGAVMARVDPAHAHYYSQGKIPLTSVATVRMQSEIHGGHLRSATAPPASERHDPAPVELVGDEAETVTSPVVDLEANLIEGTEGGTPTETEDEHGSCDQGFGSDPFLPTVGGDSCEVVAESPPSSSPIPGEAGEC